MDNNNNRLDNKSMSNDLKFNDRKSKESEKNVRPELSSKDYKKADDKYLYDLINFYKG